MPKLRFSKKTYLDVTKEPLAGSSFVNWIRVLAENRLAVDWQFIPRAVYVTVLSLIMSPLKISEKLKFDKILQDVKIASPIFIIGHWRSGTTFLHYLMGQDKNFAYVSTLQTMAPGLFLGYEKFVRRILEKGLPEKRPMDDLELNPDLPYEEEYAVANLCPYSFYHGWYFPRKIDDYFTKYVLFDGVKKDIIDEWKKTYEYLLKKITYKYKKKRVMLKSLINTARIKLLLELFPDAKFIHIYRNPYSVYLSTWKLYKQILPIFSFQHIDSDQLDKSIIEIYKILYKKFFEEINLISKDNFVEIRYEDFVETPVHILAIIYKKLGLEGFKESKPAFEKYVEKHKNYKQDVYELTEEIKENIYREWEFAFKKFGYKEY